MAPQRQPPAYDSAGINTYTIPTFRFSNGKTLTNIQIAYRSYNPESNHGVVLIPTCFGGRINTTLTFTQSPNNSLAKHHVVVVAMMGNGESSSPSTFLGFPEPGELRYEDQIRAQYLFLSEGLQIKGVEAVVGFSMGGQQAYHWGVMYPDFVKRVVAICSSARTGGLNYAFLEGPCSALIRSEDYQVWKAGVDLKELKGELSDRISKRPVDGLGAFGRAYAAWLTSHEWFREMWWNRPTTDGGFGFESIEEFLQFREAGYHSWDPDDLLVLARMWQMADIGLESSQQTDTISQSTGQSRLGGYPGDDELFVNSLKSIKAKVLVMPCRTDQYFPPHDSEIEVKSLQNGTLKIIDSVWGHLAGGGASREDIEFMDKQLKSFMEV